MTNIKIILQLGLFLWIQAEVKMQMEKKINVKTQLYRNLLKKAIFPYQNVFHPFISENYDAFHHSPATISSSIASVPVSQRRQYFPQVPGKVQ